MSNQRSFPDLREEDCIKLVVGYLTSPQDRSSSVVANYGYDLYLPNAMRAWLQANGIQFHDADAYLPEISRQFYSAAWELCRRGILRPGVTEYGAQSTQDGSGGNGYSVTPFGRQWLSETDRDTFVPTEPGRFSEMMAPFAPIFGPGFHERANEAIRCYGAHAYLACSVMCGAAAESILLHLAITKEGDEQSVLTKYRAASGRRTLENLVIAQRREQIRQDFEVCFSLLKYWRDEAAHGRKSAITENEAFTSIGLLLRCAQFGKDNYQSLTGHSL
jgi:hypothetical protein